MNGIMILNPINKYFELEQSFALFLLPAIIIGGIMSRDLGRN